MSQYTDRDGKPIDLAAVLEAHYAWRRSDGSRGQRANLDGANLTGANLTDADLSRAYLSGADGIIVLTETDHGYRVYVTQRAGEWRIGAGCRDFSISEARAHWGASNYRCPLTGRRILACLDWLEREINSGLTLDVVRQAREGE